MPAIVRRPTPRSGNMCISRFAAPSANRAFSRHRLFEILWTRNSCISHSCSLPCLPMYRCLYSALRRMDTLINFTAISSPGRHYEGYNDAPEDAFSMTLTDPHTFEDTHDTSRSLAGSGFGEQAVWFIRRDVSNGLGRCRNTAFIS